MGLDNYFTRPKATESNLARFRKAQSRMLNLCEDNGVLDHTEDDDLAIIQNAEIYLEPLDHGTSLVLVGGGMSSGENGSFRGKYYSTLCDALLYNITSDWLYRNHFKHEIDEAYRLMASHHQKLLQNPQEYWDTFKKEYLVQADRHSIVSFVDEYTPQRAIDFCEFFSIYANMKNDDVFLNAWYQADRQLLDQYLIKYSIFKLLSYHRP